MSVATLINKTLKNVAKSELPPILRRATGNLFEVLSRRPTGCNGMKVHQTRWSEKQISDSYWVVTRARFKNEGKHGKAWGKLYWRGNCVSPREELIRGSLKYSWKEGRSKAKGPELVQIQMKPPNSQLISPSP